VATRPGRRRPRLEDVAAAVGVSTGTVSLVLNGAAGPSAATRDRVLAAAAELGYRADRTAARLARRRAQLLGVMLDVRSTFHADLAAHVQDAAETAGYDVLLSSITPTRDSRRAVETLLDSRCEALVLLGPDGSTTRLNDLGEQLPVVVVGRRLRTSSLDVVRSADDVGVADAVEHLAGLGHRDVAFVDGGRGTIATDRRSGYLRGMRRRGLDRHVRVVTGGETEQAGTRAADELLTEGRMPTAVVSFNDRVALGLLGALTGAGLSVPRDVSLVGYDDSPAARLPHVDLTSVSQDTQRQAESAVRAALERLDDGRTAPTEVVIDPRLVVRRTTGPA
jgi:DNA-binding LacI/PurR family transcriptional regulator